MAPLSLRLLTATAAVMALPACSSGPDSSDMSRQVESAPPADAAAGTWQLDPTVPIDDSSTEVTALVTNASCNSGVTGEVYPPEVVVSETEVVLTFLVSPSFEGNRTCQANEMVPYTVELDEPLGGRTLRDGTCSTDAFLAQTSLCDPARWSR